MLSSTNTIVRASLGLEYHNGWGAYYRGLRTVCGGGGPARFWETLDVGSPF